MGNKFFTLLLLLIIISLKLSAEDTEEQMEKLFSSEDETYISTELQQRLEYLQKHKLDINKADYNELAELPWLSPQDVDAILLYRKTHSITSMKKLQEAGISEDIIQNLQPYISYLQSTPVHFISRQRMQYKEDTGYDSPLKFYQRYQAKWRNFSLYFLSQKDEGEKDWLDYWSATLYIMELGFVKNFAAGNYRLSFGQGILFAPKLALSKGGNATHQPLKHYRDVKPYTSTNEVYSLFGFAGDFSFYDMHIIPFYSNYALDGIIENGCIKSIDITGFHRSDSGQDKKDAIREKLYGAHISYGDQNRFGVTAYRDVYNHPFCDSTKKQFQDLYSADYYLNYRNITLFGEGAYANGKRAFVTGVLWQQGMLENIILYRDYEKDFPTFHGNPFHAGGDFDNEKGLYYGITLRPFERSRLDVYFDVFRFPEESTYGSLPIYGFDSFVQFDQKWKTSRMRFTYHHKQTERWRSFDEVSKLYQVKRNTCRLDFIQKINDKLEFKFRGEFTYHHYANTEKYDAGILLYQEMKYFITPKLKNYVRVCQYHTGDIILYMYENDLDGIMLNSQFKGDGVFGYILLKYDIGSHFSIQAKYAEKIWKEKQIKHSRQIKFQIETSF
ncbi:MAG: helix-hairpin-helix domain-containing protein [Candidatus Cloacimonetes bacterium]|nr:helix-hairpin-helix domain-containing protein [Candidatus Cloacimonadota bacterium]